MTSKSITIHNRSGLHARPASDFVALATTFDSKITVTNAHDPSKTCNAKSIVSLLTLGLVKGTTVNITADGPDEEAAAAALAQLIDKGFDEGD